MGRTAVALPQPPNPIPNTDPDAHNPRRATDEMCVTLAGCRLLWTASYKC